MQTVDITPTPAACRQIARLFAAQKVDAEALAARAALALDALDATDDDALAPWGRALLAAAFAALHDTERARVRHMDDGLDALGLFLQVKDFKPLSRVFLQLLGQTSAYRVAQTHGAHGEATALCGSNERVEALRTCRYAPFATLSDGNVGT